MTIRYVRSTFITDQTKFIEHFKDSKQIGKRLDLLETIKKLVYGDPNEFTRIGAVGDMGGSLS